MRTLISTTQQKKHKQWKHFTTFRTNIRPRIAPHFPGITTKCHQPELIHCVRNSRPSFFIDDVRFQILFSKMEHAPFTTPQTWHNRVWNNALKMQIKCQPNLCHSSAFLPVFRTTPPHLRKAVPQASGDSKTEHGKMLNIVSGPFIQQKQERRRKKKGEIRRKKKRKEKKRHEKKRRERKNEEKKKT